METKRLVRMTSMAAGLLAAAAAVNGQAAREAASTGGGAPLGPRLRLRLTEVRGDGNAPVSAGALTFHAGDKGASLFVGSQVPLKTSDKAGVIFKNTGLEASVQAEALADGRYRLLTRFERSKALEREGAAGNPVLQVLKGEWKAVLRAGETVPLGSALDSETGEEVRIDAGLEVLPAPPRAAAAVRPTRLKPVVTLTRRQGGKTLTTRRYSVLAEAGEEKVASVFSGAMVPLEAALPQGQTTVMLKDVGAGLRVVARALDDGRYRLDLSVSDGSLAPGAGSPRILAVNAESTLALAPGETVVIASGVDPRNGDSVEAAVTLEAMP